MIPKTKSEEKVNKKQINKSKENDKTTNWYETKPK